MEDATMTKHAHVSAWAGGDLGQEGFYIKILRRSMFLLLAKVEIQ